MARFRSALQGARALPGVDYFLKRRSMLDRSGSVPVPRPSCTMTRHTSDAALAKLFSVRYEKSVIATSMSLPCSRNYANDYSLPMTLKLSPTTLRRDREGYALSYTKRITLKAAFKLEMYLDSLVCKKP